MDKCGAISIYLSYICMYRATKFNIQQSISWVLIKENAANLASVEHFCVSIKEISERYFSGLVSHQIISCEVL